MWPCTGAQYNEQYCLVLVVDLALPGPQHLQKRVAVVAALPRAQVARVPQPDVLVGAREELLPRARDRLEPQYRAIPLIVLGPSTGPQYSLYWAQVQGHTSHCTGPQYRAMLFSDHSLAPLTRRPTNACQRCLERLPTLAPSVLGNAYETRCKLRQVPATGADRRTPRMRGYLDTLRLLL